MGYADYHMHTEFSPDSREKIENYCENALKRGIEEIVFTDHCEFPLMTRYPWPDFKARHEVILRCRDKYGPMGLTIKEGAEIGQAYYDYRLLERLLRDVKFDFLIGSMHHAAPKVDYNDITITESNFFKILERGFKYTENMIRTIDFDVVGHIDYIFKYCPPEMMDKYPPEMFADRYAELFKLIIARGKGIEVNCSGLRMASVKKTLPSAELLKIYKDLGGKIVTVGSDAHSLRSAHSGIETGYANLKEAGFTQTARFTERKVSFVDI